MQNVSWSDVISLNFIQAFYNISDSSPKFDQVRLNIISGRQHHNNNATEIAAPCDECQTITQTHTPWLQCGVSTSPLRCQN